MLKPMTTALVAVLLAAPGLGAQDGGMHAHHGQSADGMMDGRQMSMQCMMGSGMMGSETMGEAGRGMDMTAMGGPGPMMLLRMDEELDLTEEQVTRLEALQEERGASHRQHMQAAMTAHREAARSLQGDATDFGAYEDALSEASSHMVEAHVAMARASVEARAVLTEAQREQLRDGMRTMRGMMGRDGSHGDTMMKHDHDHR